MCTGLRREGEYFSKLALVEMWDCSNLSSWCGFLSLAWVQTRLVSAALAIESKAGYLRNFWRVEFCWRAGSDAVQHLQQCQSSTSIWPADTNIWHTACQDSIFHPTIDTFFVKWLYIRLFCTHHIYSMSALLLLLTFFSIKGYKRGLLWLCEFKGEL